MSNPQQSQDQDAVAGVHDGQRDVGADAPRGPVPAENQAGHHPAEEQDKPDLDKFAAKLGTMAPDERVEVLKDEATPAETLAAPGARNALAGVAALVAVLALIVAVVTGRRRRHH